MQCMKLPERDCCLWAIDMNVPFYNVTVNGRNKHAVAGIVFFAMLCMCWYVGMLTGLCTSTIFIGKIE